MYPINAIRPDSLIRLNKNKRTGLKAQFCAPVQLNSKYFDYKNSYLFFKGNLADTSFYSTLDENWFQLGGKFDSDGHFKRFLPDSVQIECAKNILENNSVIYCAPTGSGKTAVANYAITKNLKEGKDIIYTSPLKALANDKYREFSSIYGKENVGILTGDIKFNTKAPIKIMTTEIYNNQASSNGFSGNLGTVIFDEAHYIADDDRGNVWENSIMNTPSDVQILCLSATIGNIQKLTEWVQSLNPQKPVVPVELTPDKRYVPLVYHIYDPSSYEKFREISTANVNISEIDAERLTEKQTRAMKLIDPKAFPRDTAYSLFALMMPDDLEDTDNPSNYRKDEFEKILKILYPDLSTFDCKAVTALLEDENSKSIINIQQDRTKPDYSNLITDLKNSDMLPALVFSLSKTGCEKICDDLYDSAIDLTSDDEKEQIKEIINDYKEKGIYLGHNFNYNMLLKGYFYHHSGLLPQYRKLIEELFSKKLLKVVAATSTLSAGINMPARTTVITGVNYLKYNPETDSIDPVDISASEFHQMVGRAGRRGIDELGNVVLYNLGNKKQNEKGLTELYQAYTLLNSPADDLRSKFKPDYQMLASYFETHDSLDDLDSFIKSSFKLYLSKNPEKELKNFETKFKRAQDLMLSQNYLKKNNNGSIELTPKGLILKMSQGLNPLMLSGLIFDEALKDLSPYQLCQMISYIAGADETTEDTQLTQFVDEKLKGYLAQDDYSTLTKEFETAKKRYLDYELKITRALNQAKTKPEDIKTLNSASGLIGFLFSRLNDINPLDTISNFSKITRKVSPDSEIAKEYNRFINEGTAYKTLSATVSILNQILRICDYALSHPKQYPNIDYYEQLKDTTQDSLLLIKEKPLEDELSL